jgi:3-isopropylmalate dehydrogenase
MTQSHKIVLLPGDGVGPEVVAEAKKVLQAVDSTLHFEEALIGGSAIDATGELGNVARKAEAG